MPRVVTLGTFDVPHIGHVEFLKKASMLTQWTHDFYIGVNSDRFVKEYKGAAPLYSQSERMATIKLLGYHNVSLNDGPGKAFIMGKRPDILVVGSDWLVRGGYLDQIGLTEGDLLLLNMNIVFVPYTVGYSTSDIKARMARNG